MDARLLTVWLFFAALCVDARDLLDEPTTCATGAKFEIYPADKYRKSLLQIVGRNPRRQFMPTIQACADFCLKTPKCGCAYYKEPFADCVYREGACSSSELFIYGSVPAPFISSGLIQKCTASSKAPVAVPQCAPGVAFDIFPVDNNRKTFHALLGSVSGLETIHACAEHCMGLPTCKCVYYPEPGAVCQYSERPCDQSDLLVTGANPAPSLTHGMANICAAPPPPPSVPVIGTWEQCDGLNFSGKPCCASTERCVAVNQWYSQCLPLGQTIPATWSGIITPTLCA